MNTTALFKWALMKYIRIFFLFLFEIPEEIICLHVASLKLLPCTGTFVKDGMKHRYFRGYNTAAQPEQARPQTI